MSFRPTTLVRTGLELQADACRIVEVSVPLSSPRSSSSQDVRVRHFLTCGVGADSPTLSAELRHVRRQRHLAREAWVTIWGLRSLHRLHQFASGSAGSPERLALEDMRADLEWLEADGGPLTVAQTRGAGKAAGLDHRLDVSTVAVPEAEILRRVRPVQEAGFLVLGVSTPAMALAAVARQHRDLPAHATAAYVAVSPQVTCVAIVRNGLLLLAREMPWGHATEPERFEGRLLAELRRSMLFLRQLTRAPVEAVVLCGDADLRALSAPLAQGLDVPVQTLDSLSGLDAAAVPEPAAGFREAVAALRPAIATAAEVVPPSNLVPTTIDPPARHRWGVGAVVAALGAGLLVVAVWYGAERVIGALRSAEVVEIERQVAALEVRVAQASPARRASEMAASRQMAVSAMSSQGPRASRLLEALAHAMPRGLALDELDLRAERTNWRVRVRGTGTAPDVAAGQSALQDLTERLEQSPFVGAATGAPSFRLLAGEPDDRETSPVRSFPPGASGMTFDVQFLVPK